MIETTILRRVFESMKEDLPGLVAKVAKGDSGGSVTDLLANSHRSIAVAEYVLNGSIQGFRDGLERSAQIELDLILRYDAGDPPSLSLVAMTSGRQALVDALASGNDGLALKIAHKIGGRDEIEQGHDHPFDIAFGYALKASVLRSDDLTQRLDTLGEVVAEDENRDFSGHHTALVCLQSGETSGRTDIFNSIIEGHKGQSKGGGIYQFTPEEYLCVPMIAYANLFISRGIQVDIDDPLLPAELLKSTTS